MEIKRLINKSVINKIINEYNEENKEDINKFLDIVNNAKISVEYGEELLNKRYEFYCFKFIDKTQQAYKFYERNSLFNNNNLYGHLNYLNDDKERCIKLVRPKYHDHHDNLKTKITKIKEYEENIANKCLVLEFTEEEIKKCMYKNFLKFKKLFLADLKDYYDNLAYFKANVYY